MFSLTLTKGKQKLGFRFERPNAEIMLKLTTLVREGAMMSYNKQVISESRYHLVVLPGMFIESVNDIRSDAQAMVEELRTAEDVCLMITRSVAQPLHAMMVGGDKPAFARTFS